MATSKLSFNGRPIAEFENELAYTSQIYTPAVSNPYSEFLSETLDAENMSNVNQALSKARVALGKNYHELAKARSELSQADFALKLARAKSILSVSGGTVADRDSAVFLATAQLEDNLRVAKALLDDLKHESDIIRKDIDVLVAISNNIRAEARLTQGY